MSSEHAVVATATATATTTTTNNNKDLVCPNCGSRDIESPHDSVGASICTLCGVVVEENAIVSAVEFVEGAGGSSSMVGQFVSATSSKAYVNARRYGFSRDSRETTLANGRRRIQEVASRLRLLHSHYVDSAHRLFTIAVEKNFVQGRRTTHVVAACLYIACRQEKSQHMLIDFADALQVNVYVLGTCFLKFRRLLGLKLDIIDPALYVYRFAAHLDLDDKANAVALTALRLVGRMKRDWIVAGRRPAGICAAALLIAARAHGFSKHATDVTKILRVCGWTVTQRVKEFELTPTAALTLEQFQTTDLEAEADPPVYVRNKIREARAQAIQDGNLKLLASGALDDPSGGKRGRKWRDLKGLQEKTVKFQTLYKGLEEELTGAEASEQPSQSLVATETSGDAGSDAWTRAYPKSRDGKAILLPNQATDEEMQAATVPVEAKLSLEEWKHDLPDSVDKEIDSFFRSEEEVKQKEVIFNRLNKDYLEQQERKESERLSAEAATKDQEKEDVAQAEGHARYKSSRTRKRRRENEEGDAEAPSTEEQLLAAVASRKISRKINYDALSTIFGDDGSFSTEVADDVGASEDPMFAEL